MHEDDRARRARNRHGQRLIDRFSNPALKKAVSAVRQQLALMAAGDDLQTAVFNGGVVEVKEDAHRAAMGQRVVGKVLVPLNGRADAGRFHVDLAVVKDQVRAEQGRDRVEQPLRFGERPENLVVAARLV